MNILTAFYGYVQLWLCVIIIFVVVPACIGESEKPHFQVDHTAGKLDIQATKETADVTFGNDKVDLLLKPGDTVVPVISVSHKTGAEKSDITEETATPQVKEEIQSNNTKLDSSRLDNGAKNATENTTLSNVKNENTSDITWKGRLNHKADEHSTTSVLKTLDEIKSLMTQSIHKDESTNEESQRFGSHDNYLDAANAIIKKVEQQQGASLSKFSENNLEDNDYVERAQEILNRYKQMEKKNSSTKYIDEGAGDGMAKYDITALTTNTKSQDTTPVQTNNTSQETAPNQIITPVLHLPSSNDSDMHNHTKNGLHNKNFTIVPLKNQKISYEFSKLKGNSPRLLSTTHVNENKKIMSENATQSDQIEKKQRQTKMEVVESKSDETKDAGFVKVNNTESKSEWKEDTMKLIENPDKNSDKSSDTSDSSISKKGEHKPSPDKSVGKSKDDSTDMSERAYASIDIDPDAVRNATLEKQRVMNEKVAEEKKNPSQEEIYATIDNNLTRNKTKEELENATRALNHTEEKQQTKEWKHYVYHEDKNDEKKLHQHHLKRLIAWAPAKSENENKIKGNKLPRYRTHHKKTKTGNDGETGDEIGLSSSGKLHKEEIKEYNNEKEADGRNEKEADGRNESENETEASKINSGKANEFFKSQEEMESHASCRDLKNCEKRNGDEQRTNNTKTLSEKQQEAEVVNEAKVENQETATEAKVTQAALQHAKKLANDVARELNKTDIDHHDNMTSKVEVHDASADHQDRESTTPASLHKAEHSNDITVSSNQNDTIDATVKSNQNGDQAVKTNQNESELKWNADAKEKELKSIKKEEEDLTQEEKVKMDHEKDWSLDHASMKSHNHSNAEKKNTTNNHTVEETDLLPAKKNHNGEETDLLLAKQKHNVEETDKLPVNSTQSYNNENNNSKEPANQSKGILKSTNENVKQVDEKEFGSSSSEDQKNRTLHEGSKTAPESYANEKPALNKVNSILYNGEEKVEETYGTSDKHMEGKGNDQISAFSAKQSDDEFRDVNKIRTSKDEDTTSKSNDLEDMITIETQERENTPAKKKKKRKKKTHLKKLYSKKKKKTVSAKKKHTTKQEDHKQSVKEDVQKKKDRLFALSQKESSDAEKVLKTLEESSGGSNSSTKQTLLSMAINVAKPIAAQQQTAQSVPTGDATVQQTAPQVQQNLSLANAQPSTTENARPNKQGSDLKETSEDVFPQVKNDNQISSVKNASKSSKEQFEFLELDPPAVTENHLDLGKTGDTPGMFPAEVRKEMQDKQINAPSLGQLEKLKKDSKHYTKPKPTKDQGMGSNYAETINEVTNTSNTEQRHLQGNSERHNEEEHKKEESDDANILTNDVSKAMEELEALMKEKTEEVNKIANENSKEKSIENQTAESVLKELNNNGEEQKKPSKLNFLDPKHLKPLEDDPIKALALFRRNVTTDADTEDFEESNKKMESEVGEKKKSKRKHRLHHSRHRNRLADKKKTIPTERNIEEILKEANNFKLIEEERLNHAKEADNKIQEKVVEKILSKYVYASELLKKKLQELKELNRRSNETKEDVSVGKEDVNVGKTSPMNETSADFYIKESTNATNVDKSSNKNDAGMTPAGDQKHRKEKEKMKQALSSLENHEHKNKKKGKNQNSNEKEYNGDNNMESTDGHSFGQQTNQMDGNSFEQQTDQRENNENTTADHPDEQFTNYLVGNAPDSSIKETSEEVYNVNTNNNGGEPATKEETSSEVVDNKMSPDKDDKELNEVNKEIDSMSDEVRKIEKQTQDNSSTLSWKNDVMLENKTESAYEANVPANVTETSNSNIDAHVGASLPTDQEAFKNDTKFSEENSKTNDQIKTPDKSNENEEKTPTESKSSSDDVNNTIAKASDDVLNTTTVETQASQEKNKNIEKDVEQNTDESSKNTEPPAEASSDINKQSSQSSSPPTQMNTSESPEASNILSQQGQQVVDKSNNTDSSASTQEIQQETDASKNTEQITDGSKNTEQMNAKQNDHSSQTLKENMDKMQNKDDESTNTYDVNKNTDQHETDLEKSATGQEADNKHGSEQEEKQASMTTEESTNDLQKQFEAGQMQQADPQLPTQMQQADPQLSAGVSDSKDEPNGSEAVSNSQDKNSKQTTEESSDQKQTFLTNGEESTSPKESSNKGKSREKNEVKEGATSLEDNQQIIDVDKTNLDQSDQKMISQLAEGKQEQPSDLIKEIKADFDKQYEVSDEMKEYTQKEREAAEKALEDMNRLTQEGDYIENKPEVHHDLRHHHEKSPHENSMSVSTNSKHKEGSKLETGNISDQKTEYASTVEYTPTLSSHIEKEEYKPTAGSHLEKEESLHPTLGIVPNKASEETATDYVHAASDDETQQNGKQIKHDEENKESSSSTKEESNESSGKTTDVTKIAENKEDSKAAKHEGDQNKKIKSSENSSSNHDGEKAGRTTEDSSKSQKESSDEKNNKSEDLLNLENLAKHFTNNDLAELFTNRSKNDTSDEKALEAATDAILKTSALMKDMKAIDQKDSKQNFAHQTTVDPYSTFKRSIRRSKKYKFG